MKQTHEYLTEFASNFLTGPELNRIARTGWELVTVHVPPTGVVVYHFRRRKRK